MNNGIINLAIIHHPFRDREYLLIIEELQRVDSDTLEATSASQAILVKYITKPGLPNLGERQMSILSTYTQRLKQLGFSLDTLENDQPAIFEWMLGLVAKNSRPSLGFIRSSLQILLNFGADINARCFGSPSLILAFGIPECMDTDDYEVNATMVTPIVIALLEKGADPLALHDNGASIFNAAEHTGLNSELAQALQRTGYDLGKVRFKTLLAQLNYFRRGFRLARSTAVDRSQSKAGVVSRRAVAGDRLED